MDFDFKMFMFVKTYFTEIHLKSVRWTRVLFYDERSLEHLRFDGKEGGRSK